MLIEHFPPNYSLLTNYDNKKERKEGEETERRKWPQRERERKESEEKKFSKVAFRALNLLITDVTWNVLRGKKDNRIDIFVWLFLSCFPSVSMCFYLFPSVLTGHTTTCWHLRRDWKPLEDMDICEFMAEEELVEIIPSFKYPKKLTLISGDFGPFVPSIPIKVPLWMALNLKRQQKCTIIIPRWVIELIKMSDVQDDKVSMINMSGSDGKSGSAASEHWREILKLLEVYCDLMPSCVDLIERREAILRTSAHALFRHAASSTPILISDVTVSNVSRAELQIIKVIVQRAFNVFQKLRMLTVNS